MVREEAFVASVSENGWAQVITDKRDACGSCRASHYYSAFGPSFKDGDQGSQSHGSKGK